MKEVYKLDIEVILENWPIALLYDTYLPVVARVVVVVHTISYICDSMMSKSVLLYFCTIFFVLQATR